MRAHFRLSDLIPAELDASTVHHGSLPSKNGWIHARR